MYSSTLRERLANFLGQILNSPSLLEMVNKAKVAPKAVQPILRHSRIQTTLDLYTQEMRTKHGGAGIVP